jgi:hypothetical protein
MKCILLIENILEEKNIKSSINIELEGTYLDSNDLQKNNFYQKANNELKKFEIKGKLKPEFWKNQWEYESDFQIGNTTQTINNYQKFYKNINNIFFPQIPNIQPISYKWHELGGKLIHVPNAMQINISLWKKGFNMLSDKNFAFFLQNSLIRDSVNNLIFFIPNQKSLDRLFLKKDYDLKEQLMSPHEISGGTKGSIACYLEKNKKDLPNNLKLNCDNLHYKIADHKYDWQKNSRVEFRLASADLEYDLKLHIVFIMLAILESLIIYDEDKKYHQMKTTYKVPRKFYDSESDNIIKRYEDGLFLDKKTHLFSRNLQEKGFSQLIKILNQVKNEMEDLIKCIKN